MNAATIPAPAADRVVLTRLFAEKSPVLIEVRFPKMATSSDWYLVHEEDEFRSIWETLGPGTEVRFSSVFDLRDATGSVVWHK